MVDPAGKQSPKRPATGAGGKPETGTGRSGVKRAEALKKLRSLRDSGVFTAEQYEAEYRRLTEAD